MEAGGDVRHPQQQQQGTDGPGGNNRTWRHRVIKQPEPVHGRARTRLEPAGRPASEGGSSRSSVAENSPTPSPGGGGGGLTAPGGPATELGRSRGALRLDTQAGAEARARAQAGGGAGGP